MLSLSVGPPRSRPDDCPVCSSQWRLKPGETRPAHSGVGHAAHVHLEAHILEGSTDPGAGGQASLVRGVRFGIQQEKQSGGKLCAGKRGGCGLPTETRAPTPGPAFWPPQQVDRALGWVPSQELGLGSCWKHAACEPHRGWARPQQGRSPKAHTCGSLQAPERDDGVPRALEHLGFFSAFKCLQTRSGMNREFYAAEYAITICAVKERTKPVNRAGKQLQVLLPFSCFLITATQRGPHLAGKSLTGIPLNSGSIVHLHTTPNPGTMFRR